MKRVYCYQSSYNIFTNIFGASMSKATVRPNPRPERALSLSGDLISSYFVKICMEVCMRGCIISYFPPNPRHAEPLARAAGDGVLSLTFLIVWASDIQGAQTCVDGTIIL